MIARLCACFLVLPVSGLGDDSAAREGPGAGEKTARRSDAASDPEGQLLVRRARAILQRYFAVSAHVTQSVRLFGQEVIGSGSYFEQRSNQGLQYRLELNVQTKVDEQPSSLLEVCDGRFLWNYRKLQGAETLSRLDLARLQQKIEEAGTSARLRAIDQWPGLGGLAGLLHSFDRAFVFETPESVLLQPQFPAWKLEGRWRPSVLATALPGDQTKAGERKGVEFEQLPPHLPNCVILFLGKDDLFPYSIVFYRLPGSTTTVKAKPNDRPAIRINLSKVRFNEPIHAGQFAYKPGDLDFSDRTEQFLKKLDLP
jgi:hypothetical protein